MRKRLREGSLNDKEIEIDLAESRPAFEIMGAPGMPGMEEMAEQLKGLFAQAGGQRRKSQKLKIGEALHAAGRRGSRAAGQRRRDPRERPGQRRGQRHRLHRRDRQGGFAQFRRARRRR
jgi:protein involved in polysaccharide export with SLBB domain